MTRLARIVVGTALIVVGVLLLVLPGPGIVTIAAGLAVLATEFAWARKLLDWFKTKFKSYFANDGIGAQNEAPVEEQELKADHEGG